MLAPSGSGLSSVELPISGGVEWLKRVQLDKLKLTLEGLQVTHASVSVKLKGKKATQQVGGKVSLEGASVDVQMRKACEGGAISEVRVIGGLQKENAVGSVDDTRIAVRNWLGRANRARRVNGVAYRRLEEGE